MGKNVMQQANEYAAKHRSKKRWQKIVTFLAAIVVFCTTYALILPAITMEKQLVCIKEEHTHTEECYEAVMTEQRELVCTQEHEHTDECFTTTLVEEEKVLVCEKDEHTHTESCYSDRGADTEDREDWEATLPEKLTGIWQDDIVAVAQSQLGYRESEENIMIDSDGRVKGYTRYGAWYGSEYSAWCAMYASFCMHYAGIDSAYIPHEASCYRYIIALDELGLYRDIKSGYTPNKGDLIFFDFNRDKQSDHVGIVTSVVEDEFTQTTVVNTIEGNTGRRVKEHSYELIEGDIIGFGDVTLAYEKYKSSRIVKIYTGEDFEVTAKYPREALPETAELCVRELLKNSEEYLLHSGEVLASLDGQAVSFMRLFDITFMADGVEVEPSSPVEINISYSNAIEITDSESTKGVHFAEDDGLEILDTMDGEPDETVSDFNFMLSSFSIAGTVIITDETEVLEAGETYGVHLDGTSGGIMSLYGSPDTTYSVEGGTSFTLPTVWDSPEKYDYTLRGWYDVTNSVYYAPGSEVVINGNTLFYADWRATSYDVGQFNSFVSNTVSTNDFIVTRVFDYSSVFNMMSETYTGTVSATSHSDSWRLIEQGSVPYNGPFNEGETLNFIFIDWDSAGVDISYPQYKNDVNDNGDVDIGIYNDKLGNILFGTDNSYDPETNTGVIGKEYLGTADHLFHYNSDENDEYYGYYYYDSKLNAASYNQSDNRFYVYDYLERTSDSDKDGGAGEYSDFLPFNSPYKNGNGQNQVTYTYDGEDGEYVGTTHYEYDAKYNGQYSEAANIGTNYWFGMSIDIEFYLPNDPGEMDESGYFGNQSTQGKDMTFEFSGDDDAWVFIDGQLVLDIGSVHGIENGIINASTGVVTINGETSVTDDSSGSTVTWEIPTLQELGIGEGHHVLTFYYLERGGSQSNCSIYFNLTPRYTFEIKKEDYASQELLNGAQFTVYDDIACEEGQETDLWTSKASYDNGDDPQSTFTVVNGVVEFWGMSAGKNYFIKETGAPTDAGGYSCAKGIICVYLDNRGDGEYRVEIIEDPLYPEAEDNPSPGFTVRGFKVDNENQNVYLIITNAVDLGETQDVEVSKKWADSDSVDHSADSVTVYLVQNFSDGTKKRYREAVLSSSNNWSYLWDLIPIYEEDGVTEIVYTIEEDQVSGYTYNVVKSDTKTVETTTYAWEEQTAFENGKEYLLGTEDGYISTTSINDADLVYETNMETAQSSELALWTATVSSSGVTLKNGAGQILTFNYSTWSSGRYYYATTSSTNYQTLSFSNGRLSYTRNRTTYYMGTTLSSSNGRFNVTTTASSALSITPMTLVANTTVTEEAVDHPYYVVTNTPLEDEVYFTVTKVWDTGLDSGDTSLYEQLEATVRLYINGEDSGRSAVLNLRNNWTYTFTGLPYTDGDGNIINYSIVEDEVSYDWLAEYGEIVLVEGDVNTYTTTVTNVYKWNHDYVLPETGGGGTYMYTVGGLLLSAAAIILLYRIKKREKEDSFSSS